MKTHLLDSRDETSWDGTSDDPALELDVDPLVLRVNLHRLNVPLDLCKLSTSTRLLLVREVEFGSLGDRFPEGDSGTTGRAFDVVLSAESLDVDFEVELSHAGDDGLSTGEEKVRKVASDRLKGEENVENGRRRTSDDSLST